MSISLYLAPAASGKTAFLLTRARALAQGLSAQPRVIVPTRLQARSWRRRLAEAGGALGVRVGTFDDLYRELLSTAGEVYIPLNDPIQYRLLRTLIMEADLRHYVPLRAMPGFVQATLELIGELKAGGILPERFAEAVTTMGSEPRLVELSQLYQAYQERLQAAGWVDFAGAGWLAAEALERHPEVAHGWSALFVDGFDDLTSVQRAVLRLLAERVDEMCITLTGVPEGPERPTVHKRFNRTRVLLEEELQVSAQPLQERAEGSRAPALAYLEATVAGSPLPAVPADDSVAMLAAPDREGEVRAALRWLKRNVVRDGMRLSDVALLARSIGPYRPFIVQVAEEFGMPVHIVDGLPLKGNPAIASLQDLLQSALPGDRAFPWQLTVEAWRSPYFDLAAPPLEITPQDADALDQIARWGSVVGDLDQWQEAFELRIGMAEKGSLDREEAHEAQDGLPKGAEAQALYEKFCRFVARVTPPEGVQPCRVFVAWLEELIGDLDATEEGTPDNGFGMLRRVHAGPTELFERDWAALNTFKDVLRGIVWAEEAVACQPVDFTGFFADLVGAVNTATYRLPAGAEALLVADVVQARGLPFRAVAVLGLAEGEFPTTLAEDPLLRDADRAWLRREFGLPLQFSTDSTEAEYFYEAITRPREALLLTRPRIADNGAMWQASPYWEELRRRVTVEPEVLTSGQYPPLADAASRQELMRSVAACNDDLAVWRWARAQITDRMDALERAVERVREYSAPPGENPSIHDGNLSAWGATFAETFGPRRIWSASRLEAYRHCPYFFFMSYVLQVEPREPPTEGMSVQQIGNLYHRIFEQLYRAAGERAEVETLKTALPEVAKVILDNAPHEEHFRATAWWEQTRQEIMEKVKRSIELLEQLDESFGFYRAEQTFGTKDKVENPLIVRGDDGDSFRLRGYIDRVDRSDDGRIRIIDYKTSSPGGFTAKAVREGEKLQLALYALAAEEALGLGEVTEGFYWHIHQAESSAFTLGKFDNGPQGAMEAALHYAWEAIYGARAGYFIPLAPNDGCPSYCPAAAFCWRYRANRW